MTSLRRARLLLATAISILSIEAEAVPTRLAVMDINGGVNPQASVRFEIQVQAQDDQGEAAPVGSDSLITVVVGAGAGYMAGNSSCTIPAGAFACTLQDVVYSKAETGVIFTVLSVSGDVLAGNSQPISVDQPTGAYTVTLLGDYFSSTHIGYTSTPAGLTCNDVGTCSGSFQAGSVVTLSEGIQDPLIWSGDCAGSSPSCQLTMNADKKVGVQYFDQGTLFDSTVAVQSTTTSAGERTDRIDEFQTEIIGRYYEAVVYDQVFAAPFSDPAVQAAVIAAGDAIRQAAQNPSLPLQPPALVGNSDTIISTSTTFEDVVAASLSVNVRTAIGPGIAAIDDLGTVASLGACIDDATQCPSEIATTNLATGSVDLDTLSYYTVDTARTVVTTETHLVVDAYQVANVDYIFADGFDEQ